MGRSVTPTYRVEVVTNVGRITPMAWDCKRDGRPNQKNIDQWRVDINKSFQPDGVNWHVSESSGIVQHISKATVIRQSTHEVVAVSEMPMFEVA